MQDAGNLCRALDEHVRDGKRLSDVVAAYEREVVQRGRDAVISSGRNSLMVLDWELLKDSPMFRHGTGGANGRH